ncbi:DUF2628 domain-containing protein, partial [Mesorhizobium sp. M0136]|uniref:DUF2628 domain-containing protein n=1 Tax=Mesorhizobium sp. M0136 TaxID=2956890 RepID=UPI003339AE57
MAIYVVMEPPGRGETVDTTFIRDGFAWLGFLVPPLWLAWHRLWVEAALAFVAMGLLSMLGERLDLETAGSLLSFLVMLFVGLEGQGLRIAALRRRGWHEWGGGGGPPGGPAPQTHLFGSPPGVGGPNTAPPWVPPPWGLKKRTRRPQN